MFKRLLRDTRGVALIEYALICTVFSTLGTFVLVSVMGGNIRSVFQAIAGAIVEHTP